jgi:anti-anti-sigma regulatory factor
MTEHNATTAVQFSTEMNHVAPLNVPIEAPLYDLLTEIILCCDGQGTILYANALAHQWSTRGLTGESFTHMLHATAMTKGQRFFEEAKQTYPHTPTSAWELALGEEDHAYKVVTFRGYRSEDVVVLVGYPEPQEVSDIQQEMIELTSELAEAQRELRRQNRSLQALIDEQHHLLQTIRDLTAPAVPLWDNVLLLPLVGHIDSGRAEKITEDLLTSVSTYQAEYVILDMSGLTMIDTTIASALMGMAQALRLLGATPVLVGINPSIAETIVHLGIPIQDVIIHNNLKRAIQYVLGKMKEGRTL